MQCSVGCTLDVVTRYNRLLRVDGVWGSDPNGGLLCVDGRFKPLYDERKRVTKPMVRKDGELVEVGWDEALEMVAGKLKAGGAEGLAMAAHDQRSARGVRQLFSRRPAARPERWSRWPRHWVTARKPSISDIEDADFIIVAGAQPLDYQRVIGYLIHRAADKGATVAVIGEARTS